MTTLQGGITEQVQGQQSASLGQVATKLGNITLSNKSGSFTLPDGVRANVREGTNITCTSNEGRNNLSIFNSPNCSVQSFSNGILRLEQCPSIQQITTSGMTNLHVAKSTIQQMNLTSTFTEFSSNTVSGTASLTKSDALSVKNNFEGSLTVSGGTHQSENDQTQGSLYTSANCVGTFTKLTAQGTMSFTDSVITLIGATSQGAITIDGSKFVDNGGTHQGQITISNNAHVILQGSKLQGAIQSTSTGETTLAIQSSQAGLTATGGQINVMGGTYQGAASITNAKSILSGATFQNATFSNSAVRVMGGNLGQATVTGGAIQSEAATYSQFNMTGGTLESKGDTFSGTASLSGLKAMNLIYAPTASGSFTASGADTSATITINTLNCSSFTSQSFGKEELIKCQLQSATISGVKYLHLIDTQLSGGTISNCSTIVISGGSLTGVTFSNCGTIIIDDCTASGCTTNGCGQVLGGGADLSSLTACNCTFVSTSNCSGITATTVGLLLAHGGTFTATSETLVLGVGGATGTNDHLTIGSGPLATLQQACLLMTGSNLTMQCMNDIEITAQNVNITG